MGKSFDKFYDDGVRIKKNKRPSKHKRKNIKECLRNIDFNDMDEDEINELYS